MSLRRVALVLLFGFTEACLITPVLVALPTPLRPLGGPVGLGVIWLTLCAMAGTRRALAGRDAGPGVERAAIGLWLLGLVAALIALTAAQKGMQAITPFGLMVQFACAALLWWRGIKLGQAELFPDEAQQRFRNGLVLFGIYAIASLLNSSYDLLPFLLPFLLAGLLALPLSYLERVEQSDGGQHVVMTWRWWRWVLTSTALALLMAIVMLAVFTPNVLNQALTLLISLVSLPLLAIGFLVGWLLQLLMSLIKFQPANSVRPLNSPVIPRPFPQRPQQAGNPIVISNEALFIIVVVLLIAVMLLMVLTTARARREPIKVRVDGGEEPVDAEPEEQSVFLPHRPDLRRWLAGITVRRLYARMVHEASKRGFTRQPSQTPYDYIPQLVVAFPGADADIRLVTDAYVAAHYGQVPDTEEELESIRAAWERTRVVPRAHNNPPANDDKHEGT